MNKNIKKTLTDGVQWRPVCARTSAGITLADIEESVQTQNAVRNLYQTYLNARNRYGVMPLILIADGKDGEFTIFENDVYTAAQYVQVRIIPGLHHSAIIGPGAAAKLQAAGHQIIYVEVNRER